MLWLCCFGVMLCGCIASHNVRQALPSWKLQPGLNPGTVLQLYVEDGRPVVEREREPSTDYVYTGNFGSVDSNARDIAADFSDLIQRYSGASTTRIVSNPPSSGWAIVFKLEHWFARVERNPKGAQVIIQGEFAGKMSLQRDGQILATRQFHTNGVPTVVDRTKYYWEADKTPVMVKNGMANTANSSQQRAYYQMLDFWQESWPLWSK